MTFLRAHWRPIVGYTVACLIIAAVPWVAACVAIAVGVDP